MNMKDKFTEEEYFSEEYFERLKKCYKRNCKKYHPDKLNENASPEETKQLAFLFSLNKAIYAILLDRDVYNEYKEVVRLSTRTNIDLKNDYKQASREIRKMFEESSDKRSFEEKARERDAIHLREAKLAQQLDSNPIDVNTFSQMLSEYERQRASLKLPERPTDEYDPDEFNKNFNENISTNVQSYNTEIVPYCEVAGAALSTQFNFEYNSYDQLYALSTEGIDQSFQLLSSHIDNNKHINDKLDYEEAIKRYHNETTKINDAVTKRQTNVCLQHKNKDDN
jgi:hypothetical protein